jgi:hypothetical protein
LQWLEYTNEINGDNLYNVRREASRYFRNKKREYLKDKINELARNSKDKNIRDLCREINEFKKDYQPRNNFVKDDNTVYSDSDVRLIEIHTAEPLVSDPSPFQVENDIVKLREE